MALETLKGIKEIGGFKVLNTNEYEKEIRPNTFICVNDEKNSISFTIQNGPIKENGVNGCQVDTIIETARIMITNLNKKFPCDESFDAISNLDNALFHLKIRKQNRELRGVEGYNKA